MLHQRSLLYPRGKVLGGCSSINGMIYMRGQKRDYNHWAALLGDEEWRWERCLRAFLKHEDHWRGSWSPSETPNLEEDDADATAEGGPPPDTAMKASTGKAGGDEDAAEPTAAEQRVLADMERGAPTRRKRHGETKRNSKQKFARSGGHPPSSGGPMSAESMGMGGGTSCPRVGVPRRPSDNGSIEAPVLHGVGGEWRVERQRLHWPVLDAVAAAANEFGIPRTEDFNSGDNEGVGYFEVNQRKGKRCSAADAFLVSAAAAAVVQRRSNLEIVCGATVRRIVLERRGGQSYGPLSATGVEVSFGPRQRGGACDIVRIDPTTKVSSSRPNSPTTVANAKRKNDGRDASIASERSGGGEIILCAGAIQSPALLQRSGIGPEHVLKAADIETVHLNRPGVGHNLQDHLQLRLVFGVQGPHGCTLNSRNSTLGGKWSMATEYFLRRSGPLAMAPSQLGIFTRSDPKRVQHCNLQFHVQPLSLPAFGQPLHDFDGITLSVCNLNPTSRGSVRLAPSLQGGTSEGGDVHTTGGGGGGGAGGLVIQPNYLTTEEDRLVAVESIRVARAIASQSILQDSYVPEEVIPGVAGYPSNDPAKLVDAAGYIGTTIFHPVGTCRMGRVALDGRMGSVKPGSEEDPTYTVVDSRLRVVGVDGLRIADASVMPTITSGNTCSPTLMVAEKCAAWILDGDGGGI